MKKITGLLAVAFLMGFTACTNDSNEKDPKNPDQVDLSNLEENFEISGLVKGAENYQVTLEALSQQGTIELAKTSTNSEGQFIMKGNIQGMGLYQLRIGLKDKVIPLTMEPNDKIKVEADYATFESKPTITGTKWAAVVTEYMKLFNVFASKQVELTQKKELSQAEQIKEFIAIRKPLDDFASKKISKDPGNPANIILSTSLTPVMGFDNWDPNHLEVLKKMGMAYDNKYSGSPIAASINAQIQQIQAGYDEYKSFQQTGSATKSNAGSVTAPEIALKNPQGKVIKLSSLRGKVVLIDFWASWCGPCRKENPNVVRMYEKYKSKGFTVYSVSLDKDAEAWKRAIAADGLVWPNHVSDLLQWDSPMPQLYGFQGIPYTVLVDKKGKIIGTNLRGPALEQKLAEVLGS